MVKRLKTWWTGSLWNDAFVLAASVVVIVMTWVFIAVADEVHEEDHLPLEQQIMRAFRTGDPPHPIGPHWLAEGARDVTALGSVAVLSSIVLLAAGYLLLSGRRTAAVFVLIASLGGLGLNSALKHSFDRERPDQALRLVQIDSFSFPSGHAMSSATIYLTFAVLLTQLTTQRRRKAYILGAAVLLTFLVGLSRVYLGVHYPTDVVAGWAAGIAWAQLCWIAARLVGRRRLRASSSASPTRESAE